MGEPRPASPARREEERSADPTSLPPDGPRVARAVLRVVVAGACWGLSAIIAKVAFDRGVAPVRMAEARVLVALVILLAVLLAVRRDLLRPPRGSGPVLVAFGLSVAAVNAAYYVAIDRLAVGVAISIQYTGPVLLLGLAAATGEGRPGPLAWVAALAGLGGAALVSEAFSGFGRLDGQGLVAAAVSAVTFGTYLLSAARAGRRGVDPATVLVWGFVVATAFWSVAAPWWSWPWARLADPAVALAVVGVGVLATLIPFFLAVGAVRILTPATAGIAATVEPPFAALFAWIFLGEVLAGGQIVGGLLVLVGVALAQRATVLGKGALAVEPLP